MRKVFAIIGVLFCCAVIFVGVQFLNGEIGSAPSSASSAPSYYDSGYAVFGADFYNYVTNNAAEAASASITIASNQVRLFKLMTQFFGYLLIALGGMGVCFFGILCFEKKPAVPESPSAPPAEQHREEEQKCPEEQNQREEEQKRPEEECRKEEEPRGVEEQPEKEEEQQLTEPERKEEEEQNSLSASASHISYCKDCGSFFWTTLKDRPEKCRKCGGAVIETTISRDAWRTLSKEQRIKALFDDGVLTREEYDAMKKQILK